MLWHSNDAPHVRILGSIHFLEGEIPDWVLAAHNAADVVVFEANLREVPPPPQMPSGLTLYDIDRNLWTMAARYAFEIGVDEEKVREMTYQFPFSFASFLAGRTLEFMGACFDQSPDAVLTARTPSPLVLEYAPEVYRLLHQEPPLDEQLACLRRSLERMPTLLHRFRLASRSWMQGEAEAVLHDLGFDEYFNEFPSLAAGLFANRHTLWLPRAAHYIETAAQLGHQLLFVVGCAHLVGPENFLADLEEHCGYSFYQD